DLGPQRERGGDVQQLLVALRELARTRVALGAEAEQVSDFERVVLHLAVARERREEPAAASQARGHRRLQRLEDREVGEDLQELKAARHAELGEAHRPDPGDVAVLEAYAPGRRPREAREHVDEGRLACAVRADDRDELAGAYPEGDAAEGAELAVVLRHALRVEDHVSGASAPRRRV